MKKHIYIALLMAASLPAMAQVPEDALRMGYNVPGGTARSQAIGGAMGALGGDLSSLFTNPAGLGFYKTSEVVLTPMFGFYNGKGAFRGSDATASGFNKFSMGASGFVTSWSNPYSKWSNTSFAIGVNRMANFNGVIHYKGQNDYSSYSENMANEFFNYYTDQKDRNPSKTDDAIIDDALDDRNISLMTKMGLYTYLVDVEKNPDGTSSVISRAEKAGIVNQENTIKTTGGITEVSLGFSGNMDDKLYIGGSIGIPILQYNRVSTYRETDANGKGNNEFNYSEYKEDYQSKGVGFNAKLGLIFKPVNQLRVGVAIHTPTFFGLRDKFSSTMTTDIDTATGSTKVFSVNSDKFFNGTNPEFKYNATNPWKFMVSGAYVFNEVADVTKQRGFVSADVEYVTYGGMKLKSADESNPDDYFSQVNQVIKGEYKGAFNFRVGGELKFNTLMTRLGFAYYGNPYKDSELKSNRTNISAGVGYRDKGLFVDLTYVYSMNKDVHFPYRVDAPRFNTFAETKQNNGNVLLTFGVKF